MVQLGVNIAIIHAGKILLTQREDFEIWCLPGGAVDGGESVAQAAIREAREETGLEVQLTHLVGIYSAPRWRSPGIHMVLFSAHALGGRLRGQAGEVIDLRYFAPYELPEPLMLGQRQRIADALSGIGGSIARSRNTVWPFEPDMTRQELYAVRDRSALSRQQFYLQYLVQNNAEEETIEVEGINRDLAS